MISLFQVFKIIFGLIISAIILVLILNFLGVYTDLQEDSQRATALRNFLKVAEDVYLSDNSVPYTAFADMEITISQDEGGIISRLGREPIFFPLFLKADGELFVTRQELDMGWWSFNVVEAMPRTRVIFNPVSPDWDSVRAIASFFPDTEFFDPKVTFGLCNGGVLQEELCGGLCEQQDFLFYLGSPPGTPAQCTAPIPDDVLLITISPSCPADVGVCITPPNEEGIGNLYVAGEVLLYKDPLDIVAASLGGERDFYGNSGVTLYTIKNQQFREELLLAIQVLSHRALLIGPEFPDEPTSTCQQLFAELLSVMNDLQGTFADEEYYKDSQASSVAINQLLNAREAHQALVNQGCDYQ